MHRLLYLIMTTCAATIVGCGDATVSAPDNTSGAGQGNNIKHGLGSQLNAVDIQETYYTIFDGYRVVTFWQLVNGTWIWRVEIYRVDDGGYVEGSGWDTYGTNRTDVDGRVRDEFDNNNNGVPDGGEAGGGIDHQG